MDDRESISIIMMLALSALLGVITLIFWCRELWQERAAIRWATQPLVDSADKGDGPESVQHGLRDADMDLAAATDQAISLSLRQCELAVQDLIAIGSAEEKPGQNDRPLVDSAGKGDGPESVLHGLRDADMDLAALRLSSGGWRTFPSTDELKTYVDVLTGDALRQSNARLLALVLAILVGVIGTLVILAVWLSPTPISHLGLGQPFLGLSFCCAVRFIGRMAPAAKEDFFRWAVSRAISPGQAGLRVRCHLRVSVRMAPMASAAGRGSQPQTAPSVGSDRRRGCFRGFRWSCHGTKLIEDGPRSSFTCSGLETERCTTVLARLWL